MPSYNSSCVTTCVPAESWHKTLVPTQAAELPGGEELFNPAMPMPAIAEAQQLLDGIERRAPRPTAWDFLLSPAQGDMVIRRDYRASRRSHSNGRLTAEEAQQQGQQQIVQNGFVATAAAEYYGLFDKRPGPTPRGDACGSMNDGIAPLLRERALVRGHVTIPDTAMAQSVASLLGSPLDKRLSWLTAVPPVLTHNTLEHLTTGGANAATALLSPGCGDFFLLALTSLHEPLRQLAYVMALHYMVFVQPRAAATRGAVPTLDSTEAANSTPTFAVDGAQGDISALLNRLSSVSALLGAETIHPDKGEDKGMPAGDGVVREDERGTGAMYFDVRELRVHNSSACCTRFSQQGINSNIIELAMIRDIYDVVWRYVIDIMQYYHGLSLSSTDDEKIQRPPPPRGVIFVVTGLGVLVSNCYSNTSGSEYPLALQELVTVIFGLGCLIYHWHGWLQQNRLLFESLHGNRAHRTPFFRIIWGLPASTTPRLALSLGAQCAELKLRAGVVSWDALVNPSKVTSGYTDNDAPQPSDAGELRLMMHGVPRVARSRAFIHPLPLTIPLPAGPTSTAAPTLDAAAQQALIQAIASRLVDIHSSYQYGDIAREYHPAGLAGAGYDGKRPILRFLAGDSPLDCIGEHNAQRPFQPVTIIIAPDAVAEDGGAGRNYIIDTLADTLGGLDACIGAAALALRHPNRHTKLQQWLSINDNYSSAGDEGFHDAPVTFLVVTQREVAEALPLFGRADGGSDSSETDSEAQSDPFYFFSGDVIHLGLRDVSSAGATLECIDVCMDISAAAVRWIFPGCPFSQAPGGSCPDDFHFVYPRPSGAMFEVDNRQIMEPDSGSDAPVPHDEAIVQRLVRVIMPCIGVSVLESDGVAELLGGADDGQLIADMLSAGDREPLTSALPLQRAAGPSLADTLNICLCADAAALAVQRPNDSVMAGGTPAPPPAAVEHMAAVLLAWTRRLRPDEGDLRVDEAHRNTLRRAAIKEEQARRRRRLKITEGDEDSDDNDEDHRAASSKAMLQEKVAQECDDATRALILRQFYYQSHTGASINGRSISQMRTSIKQPWLIKDDLPPINASPQTFFSFSSRLLMLPSGLSFADRSAGGASDRFSPSGWLGPAIHYLAHSEYVLPLRLVLVRQQCSLPELRHTVENEQLYGTMLPTPLGRHYAFSMLRQNVLCRRTEPDCEMAPTLWAYPPVLSPRAARLLLSAAVLGLPLKVLARRCADELLGLDANNIILASGADPKTTATAGLVQSLLERLLVMPLPSTWFSLANDKRPTELPYDPAWDFAKDLSLWPLDSSGTRAPLRQLLLTPFARRRHAISSQLIADVKKAARLGRKRKKQKGNDDSNSDSDGPAIEILPHRGWLATGSSIVAPEGWLDGGAKSKRSSHHQADHQQGMLLMRVLTDIAERDMEVEAPVEEQEANVFTQTQRRRPQRRRLECKNGPMSRMTPLFQDVTTSDRQQCILTLPARSTRYGLSMPLTVNNGARLMSPVTDTAALPLSQLCMLEGMDPYRQLIGGTHSQGDSTSDEEAVTAAMLVPLVATSTFIVMRVALRNAMQALPMFLQQSLSGPLVIETLRRHYTDTWTRLDQGPAQSAWAPWGVTGRAGTSRPQKDLLQSTIATALLKAVAGTVAPTQDESLSTTALDTLRAVRIIPVTLTGHLGPALASVEGEMGYEYVATDCFRALLCASSREAEEYRSADHAAGLEPRTEAQWIDDVALQRIRHLRALTAVPEKSLSLGATTLAPLAAHMMLRSRTDDDQQAEPRQDQAENKPARQRTAAEAQAMMLLEKQKEYAAGKYPAETAALVAALTTQQKQAIDNVVDLVKRKGRAAAELMLRSDGASYPFLDPHHPLYPYYFGKLL